MIDKRTLACDLKSAILYYTEITINEQLCQEPTPEGDQAWEDVKTLINKLVEA